MLASSPSPAKASKWATIATTVKNHDMIALLKKHGKTSKRGFGRGRKRTESSTFSSKWSSVRKEFQAVRKFKSKIRDLIFNAPAITTRMIVVIMKLIVKMVYINTEN